MLFFTIGVLLLFGIVTSGTASAEKDTYVFILPLAENVQSENLVGMLERVAKVISETTGVKFKVDVPIHTPGKNVFEIVEKAFREGKADFGYVQADQYVRYTNEGGRLFIPIFTLTLLNKPVTDMCLYTRKADDIRKVADLKGRVWGAPSLLATCRILHENGVKESPEKFFSKMLFVPDINKSNLLDALLDKEIDVFQMDKLSMKIPLSTHERGREIEPFHCSEHYHNWIFIAKKGAPLNVMETAQELFFSAHKNKAFQEFWWFLSAVKGRFVPFEEEKLERTRKLVELENKFGWREKEIKFAEENWTKYLKSRKEK